MNTNESTPKRLGCCRLAPLEKEALSHIFKVIVRSGMAPTAEELRLHLKKSVNGTIDVLDSLEEKDLLLRKKGTQRIISIYPFSLTATSHRVILEGGKQLFAMCAVDAVGVSSMFDKDVKVISLCGWCKQEVTIEIKNGEIIKKSHPHTMIWNLERQEGPAAETCCPMINFFCSNEHFAEWESANPDLSKAGQGDLLEQAYQDIKERWKSYGERVGVR